MGPVGCVWPSMVTRGSTSCGKSIFLGFMRIQKLHEVFLPVEGNEPLNAEKNAEASAELIQCLDDRSLSLVIRDVMDGGRKALQIMRDHYLGKSKPRIIALYTELTSLFKKEGESVTDYMLRAETTATSLKSAGEIISDSLLIATILKGIPSEYKTLCTVITQRDREPELTFAEFKVALRSFEETEKQNVQRDDSVMKVNDAKSVQCFVCRKYGHKSYECKSRQGQNPAQFSRKKNGVTRVSPQHIIQSSAERKIWQNQPLSLHHLMLMPLRCLSVKAFVKIACW